MCCKETEPKYRKGQKVFYYNGSGGHDYTWGTIVGFYDGKYVIQGWYDTKVIDTKTVDKFMMEVSAIVG